MEKFIKYMTITCWFLVAFSSASTAFAFLPCDFDANGKVTSTSLTEQNNYGWCLATPQSAKITIQYLGMCKNEPTVSNYADTCEALVPLGANKQVTISRNAAQNLAADISISEGTYRYAAILITNVIEHQSVFEFDTVRKGTTPSSGVVCWSTDGDAENTNSSDPATYLAKCGSAVDSTLGYNVSTKHQLNNPANNNAVGCLYESTTPTTSYTVNVMQGLTESTHAKCVNNADGVYMLGLQTFNTPVTISPTTTNIDLGLRLENTFGISFARRNNEEYIRRFTLGGFEFKVVPN